VPEFKQHKHDELRALFRALVRNNCTRGNAAEALSAMAEALQEGLANYAVNERLPHAQSSETLMRAVTHLLSDPVNEPYASEKIELGMQLAHDEFAQMASQPPEPEAQKSKYPRIRLVMMDNHPVPA
jgi:hypothetical protein